MTRTYLAAALSFTLVAISAPSLRADVRSDERTLVKFEGMMGKVIGLFAGKAAREGVKTTVAVKGDRKISLGDESGQIVDLKEEKIYDLDLKRKTYRVTTFAQVRQQLEEARRKAAEEIKKAQAELKNQPPPAAQPSGDAPQFDVDFNLKETGEKKSVNGFNARQIVMTIGLHEKGKSFEQSGGIVLTSNIWMTPAIPAMKEVADFDLRYAKAVAGTMITGASADEMAAAMAMYPMMKDAIERMRLESVKMDGTAVQTVTTIDAVKSPEQIAAEKKEQPEQGSQVESLPIPTSRSGAVAGVLGGLGRRMATRNKNEAPAADPGRVTFMTMTNDVLKVETAVSDAEVAIPSGFKEAN